MNCARCKWIFTAVILLICASLMAAGQEAGVKIVSPEPGLSVSDESVAVKVVFAAPAGRKIDLVELHVDGNAHASRVISPAAKSGACSLQWDAAGFDGGSHALSVIARDTTGATTTAELNLLLVRPQGSEDAFRIDIEAPKPGATVSGTTEVRLRAEHPSGVKYVMLFVDDYFAFMTNKPPFEYLWNTRRAADGVHTLTARAQAGAGQEAVSQPVQVTVRNTVSPPPEGRKLPEQRPAPAPAAEGVPEKLKMVLMADTRPMSPATAAQPVRYTTARAPARAPSPVPAKVSAPQRREKPEIADTQELFARSEGIAPQRAALQAAGAAAPTATGVAVARGRASTPAMKTAGQRLTASILPETRPAVELPAQPSAGGTRTPGGAMRAVGSTLRRAPVASPAAAGSKTRPAPTIGGVTSIAPVAPRVALPQPAAQPVRLPAFRAGERLLYIDGQPLKTDPALGLKAGIAAGPFRQIVEHCGGSVAWDAAKQTVSASLLAREMRLTIGKAQAMVDERPIALDFAPYLEKARTMVPLRFFRDALYFSVEYDSASGRICIYR